MMASMQQIHPALKNIAGKFRAILLDAYGVFWGGNETGILPGAADAMQSLVAEGKIVGVLSNSTQLAAKELDKLARHGLVLDKHFHFLLTSGEVARSLFLEENLPFQTPRHRFWVFGGMHPRFSPHHALFDKSRYTETEQITEADFIYVGIPHIAGEDQTQPEKFLEQVKELRTYHLPMLCANPDRFAHEGHPPRAVVRQGTIAAMYEACGGIVHYIGKPHKQVYSAALTRFENFGIASAQEILMVGDTPETDIRGARLLGLHTALTLETGMMADRIAEKGLEQALAALMPNDQPDFLINRLGSA